MGSGKAASAKRSARTAFVVASAFMAQLVAIEVAPNDLDMGLGVHGMGRTGACGCNKPAGVFGFGSAKSEVAEIVQEARDIIAGKRDTFSPSTEAGYSFMHGYGWAFLLGGVAVGFGAAKLLRGKKR